MRWATPCLERIQTFAVVLQLWYCPPPPLWVARRHGADTEEGFRHEERRAVPGLVSVAHSTCLAVAAKDRSPSRRNTHRLWRHAKVRRTTSSQGRRDWTSWSRRLLSSRTCPVRWQASPRYLSGAWPMRWTWRSRVKRRGFTFLPNQAEAVSACPVSNFSTNLAYLRMFVAWESFLEQTFYRYMCGSVSTRFDQQTMVSALNTSGQRLPLRQRSWAASHIGCGTTRVTWKIGFADLSSAAGMS